MYLIAVLSIEAHQPWQPSKPSRFCVALFVMDSEKQVVVLIFLHACSSGLVESQFAVRDNMPFQVSSYLHHIRVQRFHSLYIQSMLVKYDYSHLITIRLLVTGCRHVPVVYDVRVTVHTSLCARPRLHQHPTQQNQSKFWLPDHSHDRDIVLRSANILFVIVN